MLWEEILPLAEFPELFKITSKVFIFFYRFYTNKFAECFPECLVHHILQTRFNSCMAVCHFQAINAKHFSWEQDTKEAGVETEIFLKS